MMFWILSKVPTWFRTRWPLKKYYWQQDDLDAAMQKAKELQENIKWE